jgi:hypothetical protein
MLFFIVAILIVIGKSRRIVLSPERATRLASPGSAR